MYPALISATGQALSRVPPGAWAGIAAALRRAGVTAVDKAADVLKYMKDEPLKSVGIASIIMESYDGAHKVYESFFPKAEAELNPEEAAKLRVAIAEAAARAQAGNNREGALVSGGSSELQRMREFALKDHVRWIRNRYKQKSAAKEAHRQEAMFRTWQPDELAHYIDLYWD